MNTNLRPILILIIIFMAVLPACSKRHNVTCPLETPPSGNISTATPTLTPVADNTATHTATVTLTFTWPVPTSIPTPPVVSVSHMASFPSGSLPTIRRDATGFIISYYNHDDMWLLKTDAAGNSLWSRNYYRGSVFSDYADIPYSVASGPDGYFLTGDSHPQGSVDDLHDFIAIKTDLYGNEVWRRVINDKASYGAEVTADNDGGIFTCVSAGQSTIIKYSGDVAGNTVWTKTYSPIADEIPGVVWTGSGFFVTGGLNSLTTAFSEMLDNNGIGSGLYYRGFCWSFALLGPFDSPSCAVPGRGFLTVRSLGSVSSGEVGTILFFSNTSGGYIWSREFGNPGAQMITAGVASDGNWIVLPSNLNNGGTPHIIILNYDSSSTLEVPLTGMSKVDSITRGQNNGEFIIAGISAGSSAMVIKKITIN